MFSSLAGLLRRARRIAANIAKSLELLRRTILNRVDSYDAAAH
jgi:hypothetical protein